MRKLNPDVQYWNEQANHAEHMASVLAEKAKELREKADAYSESAFALRELVKTLEKE